MKRSTLNQLLLLAGVVSMTGCAIGPDYQRPAVPLPEAYRAAPETTVTSEQSTKIMVNWWTQFNDEELNALVDRGLKQNADLAAAAARVREAAGLSKETDAAFIPQVDAEASTAQIHSSGKTQTVLANSSTPDGTLGSSYTSRRAALTTSYEVDLWGKLRRSSEAADANAQSSLFAHDAARLSLAAMITNGYLTLRSLDAQLLAATSSLQSREETLKLIKVRVQSGLSSPTEALQATALLSSSAAQLASLRQQRATTLNQLALLVGQPGLNIPVQPASTDKVAGIPLFSQLPLPPQPPAGLPSDLLANRPDIRQSEANLIASNARIGVAKSAFFPKLALTGYLGSESRELGDLFRTGAGIWSSGFALSLPIFDFGRTQARVAQATAQQEQAVAAYQKAIQTAFKEVSDALAGLQETRLGEAAQIERREANRKVLEITQKRYTAGSAAYLELLEAQRSANDAEIAWITSRQNQLTASVDFFKALGGGWQATLSTR